MGNVVGLKTRPQRFDEDQARALKQALLPFLDDQRYPQDHVQGLLHDIDRKTRPDALAETFIMLKPAQNAAVIQWLGANSRRPAKAMMVWGTLFEHLYPHTGQIMLSREQIAETVGIRPTEVSAIMGELAKCHAVFTERRRVEGVRGPGQAIYFMNKHVAEYGSRATEEELNRIPKPIFTPVIVNSKNSVTADDIDNTINNI